MFWPGACACEISESIFNQKLRIDFLPILCLLSCQPPSPSTSAQLTSHIHGTLPPAGFAPLLASTPTNPAPASQLLDQLFAMDVSIASSSTPPAHPCLHATATASLPLSLTSYSGLVLQKTPCLTPSTSSSGLLPKDQHSLLLVTEGSHSR